MVKLRDGDEIHKQFAMAISGGARGERNISDTARPAPAVTLVLDDLTPDPTDKNYRINFRQTSGAGPKKSASARALERIKDIDDPSQGITVVEIDNPIDEDALEAWLDKNGYKALSSPTA
ncbi:MAG: hypothetical protein GC158_04250 [Cyanobacteria bacterium RI_101]|nr:hypothetical protein [Cyanobacteria bacterium RI_101]